MTARSMGLVALGAVLLAGCSYPKAETASGLTWQKTSELAPPLEQARQDCKTQALADTANARQTGGAIVGGEFVKCMRAAGWVLVER